MDGRGSREGIDGGDPTPAELAYVERLANRMALSGLPRMAGRMWAWLMICEPAEQTAAEIAHHLHASRGSISGSARLLEQAGLIERITRRGDRREWFRVPPAGLIGMYASQGPVLTSFRRLMDEGLELLSDRPDEGLERLRRSRRLLMFFEQEYPALIARFVASEDAQDRAAVAAGRESAG